jgi:Sugar (and other) transporter
MLNGWFDYICSKNILFPCLMAGKELSIDWFFIDYHIYEFFFFLQISFGPISWLMVSEIFPSRTRGRGISLAVLMNFGSNALVTFAFSPLTVIIYTYLFKNFILCFKKPRTLFFFDVALRILQSLMLVEFVAVPVSFFLLHFISCGLFFWNKRGILQ